MKSRYYSKNLFVKYKIFEHQRYLIVDYDTYEINDFAYSIWKMIEPSKSVQEIVDEIISVYCVKDCQKANQEIQDYLEFLENAKLIYKVNKTSRYAKPSIKKVAIIPATIIS